MSAIADPLVQWHVEFAKVISCTKCSKSVDPKIIRDGCENVPQPGYIGKLYQQTGLLLVGQNPYVPNATLVAQDRVYTAALRALRDSPTEKEYGRLQAVLDHFIPQWPVQNNYFPLRECGLSLDDIAYLNLVRCRTGDKAPNARTVDACGRTHFEPWLDKLKPSCVVFIGHWARERGRTAVAARRIRYATIDRNRSLTPARRSENRFQVAQFVRENIRSNSKPPNSSTGRPSILQPNLPLEEKDMWTDPNRTIALLDELQNLGFPDEAFAIIHPKGEKIETHYRYCKSISSFRVASRNPPVQQRLDFVLNAFREPGITKDWIALAKEACAKIPF